MALPGGRKANGIHIIREEEVKRILGWLGIVALFAAVLAVGPSATAAERGGASSAALGLADRSESAQAAGLAVTPQATCSISRGGHAGSYICGQGYWIEDIRYDARCHTFITGTNRQIYYAWETTTASNAPCNNTASQGGTWSNWHSLGGQGYSGLGAAVNGSFLGIAVVGVGGVVYCNGYRPSTGWTGWTSSC
jgi:hypothetical protein